jgi:lactoylglutathione lyase
LSLADGARIEVMTTKKLTPLVIPGTERMGFTHLAISVGSEEIVDSLAEKMGFS